MRGSIYTSGREERAMEINGIAHVDVTVSNFKRR
jgi:hypothetical protein